ncbi:MAG: winged helix-turn-helix transcriptional regulator [Candidatus Woesearchaeota archaeon]
MGEEYRNKLLFELAQDARIRQREISKKLKISPQRANYTIQKLRNENIITAFETIIDPARFGLTNIIVVLAYTNFAKNTQKAILDFLKESEQVTYIDEISQGADLIVEYSVPNLSSFNKAHTAFLEQFSQEVKVVDIFPVIVRHLFPKRYLYRRSKASEEMVLSGDREPADLSGNTKKIIRILMEDPTKKVVDIARETELNVRTVTKTMQQLHAQRIIRGYTVRLNNDALHIGVGNVFIRIRNPTQQLMRQFIEFCKQIPEVTMITKLIGQQNLFIRLESCSGYRHVLDRLRAEFKFYEYTVYDSSSVLKNTYIPFSEVL